MQTWSWSAAVPGSCTLDPRPPAFFVGRTGRCWSYRLRAAFGAYLRPSNQSGQSPHDDIQRYWNRRNIVRERVLALVFTGLPPVLAVGIVALSMTGDWRAF